MVSRIKDCMKRLLFNDELHTGHRLLNLTLMSLCVGSFISLVISVLLGMHFGDCAAQALMLISVFLGLIIANRWNNPELATYVVTISVNIICLPVMYVFGGGINSGMPIWQSLGLFLPWIVIKGKGRVLLFIVSVIAEMICFSLEFIFPGIIVPLDNEIYVALDIAQSALLVSCIVGCVFKYTAFIYDEQRRKIDDSRAELREAVEIAKSASQAKSDFLANMSHEIRTPINAVLGMDEMILRECQSEEIRDYAYNIKNAGHTLLSLINDILDFSKIESGNMEIIPSEYHTSELLNDCYNLVSGRAENKGLELIFKNDETFPSKLYGDEVRVRQIIVNLLTNAVKYTDKGTVTLILSWDRVNDSDDMIMKVFVKDTGRGIKEESLKNLFDSFKRMDENKNHRIEGTGLGLTITKLLLDYMGGSIQVESKYGIGSEFRVFIPQRITNDKPVGNFSIKHKAHHVVNAQYKELFRAPEGQILVVDDLEMNLEVFKALLKSTKVNIDTAKSGQECLNKLRKKTYHMIFMDHMMPDMDGVETFHQIKAMTDNPNCNIPVIVLTANAIVGAEEEYLNEGFADYIAKPVRGKVLEKVVARFMPKELLMEPENEQIEVASDGRSFIDKLTFLDTKAGIAFCAYSEELYEEIVGTYVSSNCVDKLRECFNEERWDDYRVYVHGLKSSSKTIGAQMLSEQALHLETAAKQGDVDYIRRRHEKLIEAYVKLLSDIHDAMA